MKKLTFWSVLMLMVMALPVMISCGSGDSDDTPTLPGEYITPEEAQFREICQMFGLNRDEYDKYYKADIFIKSTYKGEDITDKRAVAMINKNTKKLFVGVYNINTKIVLLKNNEETVDETVTVTYYEDKFDCSLSDIHLCLVEGKNIYFLLAELSYYDSSKKRSKILPLIFCSKGNKKKKLDDDWGPIYPWSENSCLFMKSDFLGLIFTDEGDFFEIRTHGGKELSGFTFHLSFEYLFPTNDIYFLSCYDLINLSDRGVARPSHFSISYKNYIILYRINLLDQEIQWYVVAPLFNDLPQNINYKKTVESKELNGDILTVNYKAVAESGEVWRDTIKVNINTGELVN